MDYLAQYKVMVYARGAHVDNPVGERIYPLQFSAENDDAARRFVRTAVLTPEPGQIFNSITLDRLCRLVDIEKSSE